MRFFARASRRGPPPLGRWLLAALLASALAAAPAAVSQANGRVGQFVTNVAGPYEIALGTIPDRPVVGVLHVTITVTDTSSDTPVLDAHVTVAGTGPEANAPEIGPYEAVNNPMEPLYYDVSASVDRVGLWSFTVSVDSDLGQAAADYLIEVRTPNPFMRIFSWVTVLLFVTVVALGLLPAIRARRRRRPCQRRVSPLSPCGRGLG